MPRLPDDPYDLPRQRRGKTPQMHGRYPDYDVLENAGHWDEETRTVVLARVDDVPPFDFFDAAEQLTLTAFVDCVLAQDGEPRVPVLNFIDAKFAAGKLDGFRYDDMPRDPEVWKRLARRLDQEAPAGSFGWLPLSGQLAIVERFANGELDFEDMPCSRVWSVVMRATLSAFYSHPWVWNEIGFGGPAYPRGYSRLGVGMSEDWEGEEQFELDPVKDTERRGLE